MSTVGSIAVRIGADDAELQAALKRANRSLSQLGSQMRTGVNTAAKYGAALAAVGVATVGALVTNGLKAVDTQAKLARQLGGTTAAVQSLERAADLAGISQGALTSAMGNFNARLGEAQRGTGEAAKSLQRLGLDAKELAALDVDERMAVVADRMKEMGLSSQQVSDELRQLGIRNKEVAVLMLDGGDAIRKARDDVEGFGIAVSDVDAAQIEAANDAMTSIKAAVQGVSNQLAVQLAPFIEEVGKRFGDAAKETGGFRGEIIQTVEFALRGFARIADVIRGLHVVIKGVWLVAKGLAVGILDISSRIAEGWNRILSGLVADFAQTIRFINNIPGVNIPTDGIDNFSASLRGLADQQKAIREALHLSLGDTAAELQELALQKMPTDQVEEFLRIVKERAKKAAEEITAARKLRPLTSEGGDTGDEEAERHRKEIADRIERVREGLLTEQEVKTEQFEAAREALAEALNLELLTEEEHRQRLEDLESAHWDEMGRIRQSGLSALQRFTEASFGQQVKTVAGDLADMTAGVARESKAMFNVNKIAGIANAIISAHAGISKTLGAYPYPLNIGMAAAHAAAAFAQVNAIRSQSFSGGGGAAPSLAGGTPATPTTPVQGGTPASGGQTTVINLQGDSFGRKQMREFVEQLNENSADGGRFLVHG
jgi:hypothetical protein